MPKFEKPQPGNPHQLTVNQHCLPKSCIARFCESDRKVEVKLRSRKGTFRVKPDADIFCTKRTWDQRAENGYMLRIENKYRDYADQLLKSGAALVTKEGSVIISGMYCLWSLRQAFRDAAIKEDPIPGVVAVSVKLSKDDIERLEKKPHCRSSPRFYDTKPSDNRNAIATAIKQTIAEIQRHQLAFADLKIRRFSGSRRVIETDGSSIVTNPLFLPRT